MYPAVLLAQSCVVASGVSQVPGVSISTDCVTKLTDSLDHADHHPAPPNEGSCTDGVASSLFSLPARSVTIIGVGLPVKPSPMTAVHVTNPELSA